MKGILTRGDLGLAFDPNPTPVNRIIWERVWLTVALSFGSLLITWLIAFFIGIYSAVRQYSFGDYAFTFLGFIGIAVPSFLLALVLMYARFKYFGITTTGLFSNEYHKHPVEPGAGRRSLKNIWLPMLILAMEGTATLVRVMRANLLDELRKPYVITARAKGLPETRLLLKYPVRLALNPLCQHPGLDLAESGLRLGHPRRGHEPAHDRAHASQGAADPGHVFGGRHHPDPEHVDHHRHAVVGSSPGLVGPPDKVPVKEAAINHRLHRLTQS